MKSREERNNITANIWTARIIPLVLAGIVGYATYVVVALLSVNYLLSKNHDHNAAISILTIYFLLLLLMASSFLRLAYITTFDPPYVALGPTATRDSSIDRMKARAGSEEDGLGGEEYEMDNSLDAAERDLATKNDPDSPGLESFYTKDVFVCEMDGRPRWCSECKNWKPDRAHHCSTAGRCIRKMDHFCPWVGGPVGENNFKFFLQFVGYTSLYCLHILIIMAIYIHQQVSTKAEKLNVHFAVTLGIATFFFMFTAGMTGTSIHLVLTNRTQVENLGARTKIYVLAIIKPSLDQLANSEPNLVSKGSYLEVTYPLEVHESPQIAFSTNRPLAASAIVSVEQTGATAVPATPTGLLPPATATPGQQWSPTYTLINTFAVEPGLTTTKKREQSMTGFHPAAEIPTATPENLIPRRFLSERDQNATRTFAILKTPAPGLNPWDLKSRLLNWQTVMGNDVIDYLLPLRRSPCCNHDGPESQFAFGPVVDQLRVDYGLISADDSHVRSRLRRLNRNHAGGS